MFLLNANDYLMIVDLCWRPVFYMRYLVTLVEHYYCQSGTLLSSIFFPPDGCCLLVSLDLATSTPSLVSQTQRVLFSVSKALTNHIPNSPGHDHTPGTNFPLSAHGCKEYSLTRSQEDIGAETPPWRLPICIALFVFCRLANHAYHELMSGA